MGTTKIKPVLCLKSQENCGVDMTDVAMTPKPDLSGYPHITDASHVCEISPLVVGQRYYFRVGDEVARIYSDVGSFVARPKLCTGSQAPSWPQQAVATWCP